MDTRKKLKTYIKENTGLVDDLRTAAKALKKDNPETARNLGRYAEELAQYADLNYLTGLGTTIPEDKKEAILRIAAKLAAKGIFQPVVEKEEDNSNGFDMTILYGEQPPFEDIIAAEEVLDKLRILSPGDVTEETSDWEVTPEGDLAHKRRDYYIEKDELTDNDWILHLMGKWWFNLNTFIPAYFRALSNAGYKEITILTAYK